MLRYVSKNVYVDKEMEEHRWSVPGLFLILIGMAVLLGLSHFWRAGLRVGELPVEGNRILSQEEILNLAAIPDRIGMFALDLKVVQKRIEKHSFVKEVILSRELPSSIRIRVRERHPVAMLAGPEPLLIDDELEVLPNIRSNEIFDLPVITGWRNEILSGTDVESEGSPLYAAAGPIHRSLRRAVRVIRTAKQIDENLYHLISEVRLLSGGDIVLYSSEFGIPILIGRGDEARKLVHLHEFWSQVVSRESAATLQSVDLRFEDQIVARWNKQFENRNEPKPPAI